MSSHPPPPPPPQYTTPHARWRALATRDPLAHASFVYAVRSTRIYCRPTCPARLARRANIDFYDSAQAAVAALPGYRACKRCRPDVDKTGTAVPPCELAECDGDAVVWEEEACGEDRGGRRAAERARRVLEREGGEVVWREVAREVRRAPRYLHGAFRKAFGVTPGVYAAGVKGRRREEERGEGGAGVREGLTPEMAVDESSSSGGASRGGEMVEDSGDFEGLFAADGSGWLEGGDVDWNEACAVEGMEQLFDGASLEPWEQLVQWDAAAFPPHTMAGIGSEGAV